jgi:hypothetical protein
VSAQFTIDGGPELEAHLGGICQKVAEEVCSVVPGHRLEALVLGGGYGRGEGGVLVRDGRELPYNDMDFYVFLRGNRLLNDRRYGQELHGLGERLSPSAGLHVEFKIDSIARLRQSAVSMFSYDLLAGYRLIVGSDGVFDGCEHHLRAEDIPASEATRLLVNRCTGLLLARELLARDRVSDEDRDFICRNLAKARLAWGDAVLTSLGEYHWSCLERHARLLRLESSRTAGLALDEVRREHAEGVRFKLHPVIDQAGHSLLQDQHASVSALAERVWLWVESRRLNRHFTSAREYSEYEASKCDEGPAWRNCLLNFRTFGLKAALSGNAHRYPRERLLNSLPLLLWNSEVATEPRLQRYLQGQLATGAVDWPGLVGAYKSVWPVYG